VVQLISAAPDGSPALGNSFITPSLSANGRYVAFQSDATNLVAGAASGFTDIYVRDTCIGVTTSCTPSTVRASVAFDGSLPNGNSRSPSISADGRYVAFDSSASNLVPNDTNGQPDVFLRDTCLGAPAGCVPQITRISVASDGTQGNNDSRNPSIDSDGRYVTFHSVATNLVPNDTNNRLDVFLHDTCVGASAGCLQTTTRVSLAFDGSQANLDSFFSSISNSGRYILFKSGANNLVPGGTNAQLDIFIRDTCTTAISGCTTTTILADVATNGAQANNLAFGDYPRISGTGQFAVFTSYADNLVSGDTNGVPDVFLRDTCIGVVSGCITSTSRASVAYDGSQSNSGSENPAISAEGRFIAFDSIATNLIPGGTTTAKLVYVRDTCFGASTACLPTTTLLSVVNNGIQANNTSQLPAISADGRYVAFISNSSVNFIVGASNGYNQVWLARIY